MGNKRKRRGNNKSVSGTLIAFASIGLVVCGSGMIGTAPAFARDGAVRAHGIPATGHVTAVIHYTTHSKSSTTEHYYPIVTTTIGGRDHTTSTKDYNVEDAKRFSVGETVPVVYDAEDPARVVPDWSGAQHDLASVFWSLTWIGIVSTALLVGSITFRAVRKRRRATS